MAVQVRQASMPGLHAAVREGLMADDFFPANLTYYRIAAGLSLTDLERRSGISQTLLGRYERGQTFPGRRNRELLCTALDVTFAQLMAGPPPEIWPPGAQPPAAVIRTPPPPPARIFPRDARVVRSQLTMVDRSDSGCRLHGAASAETPLLPGVIFAFRMDPASPWTLAVVRRVKKRLAGKRVEIGAEYLGSNPRRVVVVIPDSEKTPPRPAGVEPPRFSAIYLPESTHPPFVPVRTLVLPSRGLAPDDLLSVRSHTDHCTFQLGEPLEEQAGFVWAPFEILDRWLRESASEPRSGAR